MFFVKPLSSIVTSASDVRCGCKINCDCKKNCPCDGVCAGSSFRDRSIINFYYTFFIKKKGIKINGIIKVYKN